jgi:hypothetical protein
MYAKTNQASRSRELDHRREAEALECGADAGEAGCGQAAERTDNGTRERVWFSPNCLACAQPDLFSEPRSGRKTG